MALALAMVPAVGEGSKVLSELSGPAPTLQVQFSGHSQADGSSVRLQHCKPSSAVSPPCHGFSHSESRHTCKHTCMYSHAHTSKHTSPHTHTLVAEGSGRGTRERAQLKRKSRRLSEVRIWGWKHQPRSLPASPLASPILLG